MEYLSTARASWVISKVTFEFSARNDTESRKIAGFVGVFKPFVWRLFVILGNFEVESKLSNIGRYKYGENTNSLHMASKLHEYASILIGTSKPVHAMTSCQATVV